MQPTTNQNAFVIKTYSLKFSSEKGQQKLLKEAQKENIQPFSPIDILSKKQLSTVFSYIPRLERTCLFCVNRTFNLANQTLAKLQGQVEIESIIKDMFKFNSQLDPEKYTDQKEQIKNLISKFEIQQKQENFRIHIFERAKKKYMDNLMLLFAAQNNKMSLEELTTLKISFQSHDPSPFFQPLLEFIEKLITLIKLKNNHETLTETINTLILGNYIKTAIEISKRFLGDYFQIEALIRIYEDSSVHGSQIDKALETTEGIQSEYYRSYNLISICKHSSLNRSQVDKALEIASRVESSFNQAQTLSGICQYCSFNKRQIDKALEIITTIQNKHFGSQALSSVFQYCSSSEGKINKVLEILNGIQDEYFSLHAFQSVLQYCSLNERQVDNTLETIKEIQNESYRLKSLISISQNYPLNKRQTNQALELTKGIQNEYYQSNAVDSILMSFKKFTSTS